MSTLGIPITSLHAWICWATRGFVGARNMIFPNGYHLQKLYITTAAMKVFPKPAMKLKTEIPLYLIYAVSPKGNISPYQ